MMEADVGAPQKGPAMLLVPPPTWDAARTEVRVRAR
jgi:hypothetical protein